MSLWGPVKTLTARREAPSLMGRVDGWDGLDGLDGCGDQKCPLNFFIHFKYINKCSKFPKNIKKIEGHF